ncbi:MAG: hypothetical protein UR39_C0011G0032 [Candidatus Woesebacteria bacterium GW2011_GWA1_33_30]|uniref:Uncharacterized protein n=1 Tax=Candidatus Woesebacteria bacterium GW2011_GWA2_33_28 TaxID=1618561 RepID=A0A0G0C580_9BACT|nr:MAG: hypothetical protein UR38_C0011G0030 [Candidatus Woesebacteria bacterium GW2011_GWA2_33_28]KKP47080.1 MAG: hypothetical protein UR39_C0011G0032 [Candidatus Woesebacteria bacterium GW2011_GWA1_33_30]KKP48694.1 MAG: hypothetical protein UR40_C0012G0030 [Microgenomates group bacterium GW2011_GWC1_33_32]KKP51403.1 MAG: hypothetical protein UR44_C0011G0030 [Candidatus Woesebacteria bacterium GW2011_GWB1_33_38]KKP57442.1 MAG: hypothetical protein UR48_C0017G0015 [Microgenomates group bacteriu
MKKEVTLVITTCLFLLAYILDYFAGALKLQITNPLIFLNESFFKLYPMTYVAVIVRSVAIMLSVTLILSIMERQYFKKLGIAFFLSFIAEIYAFQQLATGAKITPLLWTLAISYGGAILIIPIIFYIFAGIADFLIPQRKNVTHLPTSQSNDSSSVLNP